MGEAKGERRMKRRMEAQRVWISRDGIVSVLWYLGWNALIGSILQKKLHNL